MFTQSTVVENIDQDTYTALKSAVELGKWRNGEKLTREARESTLQLLMIYEAKNSIDPLAVVSNIQCPNKSNK